jgi:hypothetical protein
MTANACCPTSPSGDVTGVAKIKIVYLRPRNELLNVYGALAFYRDSLKFVRFKLDILILGDFIALDDICPIRGARGFATRLMGPH